MFFILPYSVSDAGEANRHLTKGLDFRLRIGFWGLLIVVFGSEPCYATLPFRPLVQVTMTTSFSFLMERKKA
jgi:hypothetical protein